MLKRLRNLVSPPAVEQRAALLAGKNIPYTLKRSSKRRSIGLRIDERGLTVSAPLRAPEKWLHSVLQDKASWVVAKLDVWENRRIPETCWENGGILSHLGNLLTLHVVSGLPAVVWRQGEVLRVCVADEKDAKAVENAVDGWCRHEALMLFHTRVEHFAPLLNVAPQTVKLSVAKKRWGSCNARGNVRLNLGLIKLPPVLIDYVVVHELAHLREMNHSQAFWKLVEGICPDHARLRRELKAHAL